MEKNRQMEDRIKTEERNGEMETGRQKDREIERQGDGEMERERGKFGLVVVFDVFVFELRR